MKRFHLIVVGLLLVCFMPVFAQNTTVLRFHGGYINPKGTEGSYIFGGSYGIAVDERVDIGLGISYFRKSKQDQ